MTFRQTSSNESPALYARRASDTASLLLSPWFFSASATSLTVSPSSSFASFVAMLFSFFASRFSSCQSDKTPARYRFSNRRLNDPCRSSP